MHKGLKIALIVVGSIVALLVLLFLVLYIAGGQEVKDPFTDGIDIVDVPFTTPSVVTWRLVNVPDGTKTVLYISAVSRPAQDGFAPADLGYTQVVEPVTATVDGVSVYQAAVPAGEHYVRVYADNGNKWSSEYHMEAS